MAAVKMRHLLIRAAKALREQGSVPPGAHDPSTYRVRATSKVVPDEIHWLEGVKEEVTVAAREG